MANDVIKANTAIPINVGGKTYRMRQITIGILSRLSEKMTEKALEKVDKIYGSERPESYYAERKEIILEEDPLKCLSKLDTYSMMYLIYLRLDSCDITFEEFYNNLTSDDVEELSRTAFADMEESSESGE
jgi:hypothetical protein